MKGKASAVWQGGLENGKGGLSTRRTSTSPPITLGARLEA